MWHDSVPGLFISGQVRFDTTVASTGLPLRQLGDQEGDIVRLVAPVTKYCGHDHRPADGALSLRKGGLPSHGRPARPGLARRAAQRPSGSGWTRRSWPASTRAPLEALPDRPVRPARGRPLAGSSTASRAVRRRCRPKAARLAAAVCTAAGSWRRRWPLRPHGGAGTQAEELLRRLRTAQRPVVMAGSALRGRGVR